MAELTLAEQIALKKQREEAATKVEESSTGIVDSTEILPSTEANEEKQEEVLKVDIVDPKDKELQEATRRRELGTNEPPPGSSPLNNQNNILTGIAPASGQPSHLAEMRAAALTQITPDNAINAPVIDLVASPPLTQSEVDVLVGSNESDIDPSLDFIDPGMLQTRVVHLTTYEPPEGSYKAERQKMLVLSNGTKVWPNRYGYFIPASKEEEDLLKYFDALNRDLVTKVGKV